MVLVVWLDGALTEAVVEVAEGNSGCSDVADDVDNNDDDVTGGVADAVCLDLVWMPSKSEYCSLLVKFHS